MRQPLTRESIAHAAREILVSEGLHAVSLRRVAASLGVTAPALYAHVADKRDLLQGIVEREVDGLIERFGQISAGDAIERLRLQAQAYVDYACQNPDLFRAMFLFRPELTADARDGKPALASRIIDAFAETATRAQSNDTLRGLEPQLAALTMFSAVQGVASMLLAGPMIDIDLKGRLATQAIDTVVAGLRDGDRVTA